MDMWKPFRNATAAAAPQAAILFDKFHIMRHLGEALDKVRKAEYARLSGKDRRFIKGQKYTLLSRRENPPWRAAARSSCCWAPTSGSTQPISSRKASASSGATGTKPGPAASSTTGGPASNGSASNPTSASPT